MKTLSIRVFFVLVLVAFLGVSPGMSGAGIHGSARGGPAWDARLDALAVPFIENRGQTHPDVRFYAQTFGGALFVTADGQMVYSLPVESRAGKERVIIREKLVSGHPKPSVGEQTSSVRVNIFKGEDPAGWRTAVPAHDRVFMGEVYDGVAMQLQARAKNVEKLFYVRPGADPGAIRVDVEGAAFLGVGGAGELVLTTPSGPVAFTKPEAYQVVDGRRQPVDCAYDVAGRTYGFKLGPYDAGRELVIDPLLSTYLGGAGSDEAMAIATNVLFGKLYIYVAGSTTSNDFPGTAMYQTVQGYNQDAFIALIDMDLNAVQFTYLGGDREDAIWDMALSKPDGKVYVVGMTDGHFPVMWTGTRRSDTDVFISRLSADLSTLEQSRYFGGNWRDYGTGIALYDDETAEPNDRAVYITGQTNSNDLPVSFDADHPDWLTHQSAQLKLNGTGTTDVAGSIKDAFAAKFTLDLSLRRVTYIGGYSDDSAYDIAVHPAEPHDVYVVGSTAYAYQETPYGTVGCFPWTVGGGVPDFQGSTDAFVVRLNKDLTASPAPQASYYGGTGLDFGQAVAVHPDTGDVYIAGGRTNEPRPPSTYPTDQYAFVAYFNAALTQYRGDAHIGDFYGDTDRATDLAIVSGVGIYALGWTGSKNLEGAAGGILPARRGYKDLFVSRFHNNLELDQTTYLGGSAGEDAEGQGLAVAQDPVTGEWHVFVAGTTDGSGLAGVTDGTAFQPTFKGGRDAFISRMNADLKPDATPDIEVQPRTVDFGNVVLNTNSAAKTVVLENIGATPLTVSSVSIGGAAAGDFTLNTAACGAFPLDIAGSSSCSLSIVFRPSVLNQWREADLTIRTVNDPDEPLVRVHLIGYAGPEIAVTSVTFPATQIGSSTEKTFQIKNVGTATLTVTGIRKTGIAPSTGEDFTLLYDSASTTCATQSDFDTFTLLAGRSCNIAVRFSPSPPAGPQEAMVFVFSDDLDENPAFATLDGDGVTELNTDIWSHNLEFRDTPVNGSRSLPWLITNTGSIELNITNVTLSDTNNFSLDVNGGAIPCGGTSFKLAKVSSCTMTVTFRPKSAAAFDRTITIRSNDPDEGTLVVHATGSGVGDADLDGVPDVEESGDANGDGFTDATQPGVAAVRSFDDLHTVVIESETDGSSLSEVQAINPPGGTLPGGLGQPSFPFGFYHFKVNLPPGASTATVRITLPPGETVETYIKWGPEAHNVEPHYYDFGDPVRYPGAVEIAGNVITLHLVDNGPGDHDGLLNSIIYDPGAPARLLMGDFDRSGAIDLGDAVLCLRVLTGSTTSVPRRQADVNGDGRLGLQDAIYVLQKIAGLR